MKITFLFRQKIFLLVTLQNEGWSTGVVHGPVPQGWSMDLGSMFYIRTISLSMQSCKLDIFICRLKGVVSKETVVLRRWGSSTQKFGLSTELIM